MLKNPMKFAVLSLLVVLGVWAVAIVPLPRTFGAESVLLYLTSVTGFFGVALLFVQLLLGTRSIIGLFEYDMSWALRWHKNLGIYGTLFIFLHPLLSIFAYGESLLYLFVPDLSTTYESSITWGRVALLFFLIIWVTSALIRGKIRYRPWKYLHYLSYAALPFVWLHAPAVGPALQQSGGAKTVWNIIVVGFVMLLLLRVRYLFGFGKQVYKITANQSLSDETHLMELTPLQKQIKPKAGQYIYLQLHLLGEEHPFSALDHDVATGAIRVAYKESGRFTKKAARTLVGRQVYLDGPYGSFTSQIAKGDTDAIVIAGGIGVTPFVEHARDGRVNMAFYCTRTTQNAPFLETLKAALGERFVHVVSDEQAAGPGSVSGRFSSAIVAQYIQSPAAHRYFVCGPKSFMKAASAALVDQGVSPDNIFTEEFSF